MTNSKLQWFNKEGFAPIRVSQNPDYTLACIALTMLHPDHGNALKKCCRKYLAHGLRLTKASGDLLDTDTIRLLGKNDTVYHVVLTRDNFVVIDSERPEAGKTVGQLYPQYDVVKDISVADFLSVYASRIILEPPAASQEKNDLTFD